MKKIILLLLLVTLFLNIGFAQTKVWESPSPDKPITFPQWEVIDLIYMVEQKIDKPFEAEAYAVVSKEKGTQRIPIFYNGNNEWVFRYSSATVGTQTFALESKIKELNGKQGTFNITENKKKDRHGAVVLSKEDPQHLYYEDGSHYFNLAFECDWLFALDFGQKEITKTEHLLSLLNQYGFNQVVTTVYSYDVSWPKDERLQIIIGRELPGMC